jgi:carboxyl-terminal processing protease
MDLLLSSSHEPREPRPPDHRIRAWVKPIVAAVSLVLALFLTIYRPGPEGGLEISATKPLGAAPERRARPYNLGKLQVLSSVLIKVQDNYVDPKRFNQKKMLVAALEAVERSVAEILVKQDTARGAVTVKVDSYEKTFDISTVDSFWNLSSVLKEIFQFIQAHLHKGTNMQDVEYAAINGLLSTLDPHSILMKPTTYNEMKLSTRGSFGGLGIVISMIKGTLTVMNPMKGTPAEREGLKACDQILKIGEESTVNMTLDQAVSRLRGEPGSKVDVTLMRGGWTKAVKKTLTRAVIKVPSVTSRLLGKSKVGYVKLSSFQGNSYDDLREALEDLRQKGMRALVLDLRGDPGGLLDQAIKISDAFIESGTILTQVSSGKRDERRAQLEGTEPRYPIAVLVNSGSASASEIVAGALKNLDRAVVIGSRTFGKGSVQVLYDNDDGSALKLTIAEYLTPGDVSIQANGIVPDIATAPMWIRKDFIRMTRTDQFRREKDLAQHLTSKNVLKDGKPQKTLMFLAENALVDDDDEEGEEGDDKEAPPTSGSAPVPPRKEDKNLCLYPERECKPQPEEKFVEDFQIRTARDLLSRTKAWRRSQILSGAGSFFATKEDEEEKRLIEALKKHSVDWSHVPKSAAGKPRIKVSIETDPKEGKAQACHKMTLRVTVKNEGDAPAGRLIATSSSTNHLFNGHEFVFGKVEPGASQSWEVPISVRDEPTRVDEMTLKFQEENGNVPDPVTLSNSIKGVERPVFSYGYQIIDDEQGNRDGQVQRGEQVRLFVTVRNSGKGPSVRTIATLKNLSGEGIFLRKGRFILGSLAPRESKSASFTFEVENAYSMPSFKLELMVYDDALREYVSDKLEFQIADSRDPPAEASGTLRVAVPRVEFRAWADGDAPVVGEAQRGAAFKVIGKYPSWYLAQVSPGRTAFVATKDVTPGKGLATGKFVPRWQVTPPSLSVKVPTYSTDKSSIRVEGIATDETRVQDLYISVHNSDAKIDYRKVYYTSNSNALNPRELKFSSDVPLWPGANYVSVVAKKNEDVRALESVIIFMKSKTAAVAK